jgi:hypothetical protein
MSPEWIDKTINQMIQSSDSEVQQTGLLLKNNFDLIRTKANVLDPSGVNNWNKINLPRK